MTRKTSAFPLKPCLLALLLFTLLLNACKSKNGPATLPVYEVVPSTQATGVLDHLRGKTNQSFAAAVTGINSLYYEDRESNLRIPGKIISDPTSLNAFRNQFFGAVPRANIVYRAIDFEALDRVTVPDSATVAGLADQAFAPKSLSGITTRAYVGHTAFSAKYKDSTGNSRNISKRLDTRIAYRFYDSAGYEFIGPGAHMILSATAGNRISQVCYAWRQLKRGPDVKIIPDSTARIRIASLLPAGAEISMRIVYWCPPVVDKENNRGPRVILPWYAFTGTFSRNLRGRPEQETTSETLIPATDDPRYIPSVKLSAATGTQNRINASAKASGGTPPYRYTWLGSKDSISSRDTASITYFPVARGDAGKAPILEKLGVLVTDANGVTVMNTRTIEVVPAQYYEGRSAGLADEPLTYGCESPREPGMFAQERTGWEQGMVQNGGGKETFCHIGDDSWPGNYIRAKSPGDPQPWFNGCADDSGINTANIVFVNGDGMPDYLTAMYPGAPASSYRSIQLLITDDSYPTITVPVSPFSYYVPYPGSWGPGGGGRLYWLAGLLCQCLDSADNHGLTTDQRWGPAFGGLHMFTGFASNARYTAGAFSKTFAANMLGSSTSQPQSIRNAWFNACSVNTVGIAAAMGPITANNISDMDDFYIGKGSQGPSIPPDQITGWWYLHQ